MAFNAFGGLLIPGGRDVYGSKPTVPGRIDYERSLRDIIQSNIALLPSLTELGLMSTDALIAMQERMLPGSTRLRDTTTGILGDKLSGRIPRDVQQLLERNAAEKGIALGTSGSQLSQFDELRNLGLTSLGIQNEGLAQTSQWLAQNRGNTFDFTKMFLGPAEAVRETEFNWNRDKYKADVFAAPDPVARGERDTAMGVMGALFGIYSGAAPMSDYQPSYGGGYGSYGSYGSYGRPDTGSSYFGNSGGSTIGYTPTYDRSMYGSGDEFDSPAGASASPMFE